MDTSKLAGKRCTTPDPKARLNQISHLPKSQLPNVSLFVKTRRSRLRFVSLRQPKLSPRHESHRHGRGQESRNRTCTEVGKRNARSAAPRLRRHVDTALNDVGIADPWPESSSSSSPSRRLKASSNGAYGPSLTAKWIRPLKSDRGSRSPVVVPYESVLRANANSVSH